MIASEHPTATCKTCGHSIYEHRLEGHPEHRKTAPNCWQKSFVTGPCKCREFVPEVAR